MKKSFTLKRKKSNNEYHLFKSFEVKDNSWQTFNSSLCDAFTMDEFSPTNKFEMLCEEEARIEIAKLGRKVCGNCVSHLYAMPKLVFNQ